MPPLHRKTKNTIAKGSNFNSGIKFNQRNLIQSAVPNSPRTGPASLRKQCRPRSNYFQAVTYCASTTVYLPRSPEHSDDRGLLSTPYASLEREIWKKIKRKRVREQDESIIVQILFINLKTYLLSLYSSDFPT